ASLRQAIVGGRQSERAGRRSGDGGIRRLQRHDRRQVRTDFLAVAAACGPLSIDLPHRLQRGHDLLHLPMRAQLPDQRLTAEVLRHDDAEDVLVAPRNEMRRLAAIAAWLEAVVWTDRQVDGLLVVAVYIAEPIVVRAVGI